MVLVEKGVARVRKFLCRGCMHVDKGACFWDTLLLCYLNPVEEASDKKKKRKRERLSLNGQVFAHKATARRNVFLLDKYANPFA